MTGSEKQIKWAEQIKASVLNDDVREGTLIREGLYTKLSKQNERLETNEDRLENCDKGTKKHTRLISRIEDAKNNIQEISELIAKIENCDSAALMIENRNNIYNGKWEA